MAFLAENDLLGILASDESATLEFKKSTVELRRASETLCDFLNGDGGRVLIGITPNGKPVGQIVSDSMLRDISCSAREIP
jgi:ATP-dependent DNA helicase RecG